MTNLDMNYKIVLEFEYFFLVNDYTFLLKVEGRNLEGGGGEGRGGEGKSILSACILYSDSEMD